MDHVQNLNKEDLTHTGNHSSWICHVRIFVKARKSSAESKLFKLVLESSESHCSQSCQKCLNIWSYALQSQTFLTEFHVGILKQVIRCESICSCDKPLFISKMFTIKRQACCICCCSVFATLLLRKKYVRCPQNKRLSYHWCKCNTHIYFNNVFWFIAHLFILFCFGWLFLIYSFFFLRFPSEKHFFLMYYLRPICNSPSLSRKVPSCYWHSCYEIAFLKW